MFVLREGVVNNRFPRALAVAQDLKRQLDNARAALEESLASGIEKLAPVGSVIDRRTTPFGTVNVAHGNGRNALCFEVAGPPHVELDLGHPGLSYFTVDAYPLNATGQRMSGRVAKSYGLGRRETVQLRIQVLPMRFDEDAQAELARLSEIAE